MNKYLGGKNKMVILLAVFGMICWGVAPIFAKVGLKNVNPMTGLTLRTMLAASLVISWMIFNGSFPQIKAIPKQSLILIGIEAILATLVGDLAYFAAIKKGDVSLVSIIMSSSPLVTILIAVIFLGEQITVFRMFGAVLVILGIIMISR